MLIKGELWELMIWLINGVGLSPTGSQWCRGSAAQIFKNYPIVKDKEVYYRSRQYSK